MTVSGDPDAPPVEGVLIQQGSVLGGWSFHLLGGERLVYVHNGAFAFNLAEAEVG